MAPNLPALPTNLIPEQPKPNRLHIILIFAAVLIVVVATISYYFINKQVKSGPAPSKTIPETIADRSLTCPLPASFCLDKDSYKESSFSAALENNTEILAVFDGEAESVKLSQPLPAGKSEDFTLVTLTNPQQTFQAQYYLQGEATEKKPVKEGEIIATSSGQPLSFLDNKSFVFIILRIGKEDKLEPFSIASFK